MIRYKALYILIFGIILTAIIVYCYGKYSDSQYVLLDNIEKKNNLILHNIETVLDYLYKYPFKYEVSYFSSIDEMGLFSGIDNKYYNARGDIYNTKLSKYRDFGIIGVFYDEGQLYFIRGDCYKNCVGYKTAVKTFNLNSNLESLNPKEAICFSKEGFFDNRIYSKLSDIFNVQEISFITFVMSIFCFGTRFLYRLHHGLDKGIIKSLEQKVVSLNCKILNLQESKNFLKQKIEQIRDENILGKTTENFEINLKQIINIVKNFNSEDINNQGISIMLDLKADNCVIKIPIPIFTSIILGIVSIIISSLTQKGNLRVSSQIEKGCWIITFEDNGLEVGFDYLSSKIDPEKEILYSWEEIKNLLGEYKCRYEQISSNHRHTKIFIPLASNAQNVVYI